MPRYCKLILLFSFICSGIRVLAQPVEFTPRYFKGNKEALSLAKKAISEGDRWMKRYEEDNQAPYLVLAVTEYNKAFSVCQDNAALNWKITDIYNTLGLIVYAAPQLEKLYAYNPEYNSILLFLYAEQLFQQGDFETADRFFRDFQRKFHELLPRDYLQESIDRIRQIEFTRNSTEDTLRVIHFYPPARDTSLFLFSGADWDIWSGELQMYRLRDTTMLEAKLAKPGLVDSLYFYQWDYSSGNLRLNDSFPFIDTLIVCHRDWESQRLLLKDNLGNLYVQNQINTAPIQLPYEVNNFFANRFPAFRPGTSEIWFSSNRPGGAGGWDIYIWNGKELIHPGYPLNTSSNEYSVSFHLDGKNLYVSSDGWSSIGGADIFQMQIRDSNQFSLPANLGYPLNSVGDEYCFRLHPGGHWGMMEGKRVVNGKYESVWMNEILGSAKEPVPVMLQAPFTFPTAIELLPIVKDEPCFDCSRMAMVQVDFPNRTDSIQIRCFNEINSEPVLELWLQPGEVFRKIMPLGQVYRWVGNMDGYIYFSDQVNLKSTQSFVQIFDTIQLLKIEQGAAFPLQNLNFSGSSTELSEFSHIELKGLLRMMEKHTDMKIRLGFSSASQSLSKSRLESVRKFLINSGISGKRIVIDTSKFPDAANYFQNLGYKNVGSEVLFAEILGL